MSGNGATYQTPLRFFVLRGLVAVPLYLRGIDSAFDQQLRDFFFLAHLAIEADLLMTIHSGASSKRDSALSIQNTAFWYCLCDSNTSMMSRVELCRWFGRGERDLR